MTFALNVTTAPPEDNTAGNLWDQFSPLSKLITIAAVNNKAQFAGNAKAGALGDERKVLGDATDGGLLRFCDKVMDVDSIRDAFASVFSIPFNSKNKWALNMTRIPGDTDRYLVMIKGAPEYVIQKCGRYFHREREVVMDDLFSEDMLEAYSSFGSLAERVIGHAFKVLSSPSDVILSRLHVAASHRAVAASATKVCAASVLVFCKLGVLKSWSYGSTWNAWRSQSGSYHPCNFVCFWPIVFLSTLVYL
jgi:magnesium-transporting ATPase (P-type)